MGVVLWVLVVVGLTGRMSSKSHDGVNSVEASILLGVIIQRMTLLITRGCREVLVLRVWRKESIVVSGLREMRWIVASGMVGNGSLVETLWCRC